MAKSILSLFKPSAFVMLAFLMPIGAADEKIEAPQSFVRLSGHVPDKAVSRALFVGDLHVDTHVPVTFTLPLRNQEELQTLIHRLHDPADELYGKYLSQAEFVEQFAPTQEDYDHVIAYAKSVGMQVVATHPNRTLLNVSGAVGSIESAFNLQLHRYQLPSGRLFFAPNANPEVPASVASVISGVVGLDNHAVWRPFYRKLEDVYSPQDESQASPSGPNNSGYAPKDIIEAYNLSGVSAKGSKQSIALFELASYNTSDITAYTSYFGLPAAQLTNVPVDGGSSAGADAEVTLDIELALAVAPESHIYVYEGPNSGQGVLDTYNKIATDNLAKQVSTSWGLGEDLSDPQQLQSQNSIFMQMAAQGQTIYAAAGDSGAYDDYNQSGSKTLVVDDPASQPYVVGVGGTRLTVNASTGVYQTETVWNDGVGSGGGGGVSTVWPIPSWQANVSSAYSTTHRNVPDVSLNADPYSGYSIYFQGQWTTYGGTSCAAPLWAAFTACVNQELTSKGSPPLGFANPALYKIGAGTSYDSDFHDVTQGNNSYYSAKVGYDNASGWGSFNGANLFANLTQTSVQPTPPPPPPTTPPHLGIEMQHSAPFTKGGTGTYKIEVSNQGSTSTSGLVAVALYLPTGLTFKSSSGSGWNVDQDLLVFTQSNDLGAGKSYPTIILNVDVAENAPSSVTPIATVSWANGAEYTVATNLTTIH